MLSPIYGRSTGYSSASCFPPQRLSGRESVVGLSDSSSTSPLVTYGHSAFGEDRGSSGSYSQPYGYLSELGGGSSGLTDFHARTYEPGLGRFLSRDPMPGSPLNPQTRNPYIYGYNSPWLYPDPLGLCGLTDPLDCAGDAASSAGDFISGVPGTAADLAEDGWNGLTAGAHFVEAHAANPCAGAAFITIVGAGICYYLNPDPNKGGVSWGDFFYTAGRPFVWVKTHPVTIITAGITAAVAATVVYSLPKCWATAAEAGFEGPYNCLKITGSGFGIVGAGFGATALAEQYESRKNHFHW